MFTARVTVRALSWNLTQSRNVIRPSRKRQISTLRIDQIATLIAGHDSLPSGTLVEVNGFVRSVRRQKRVAFAAIGDGSSIDPLQVVLDPKQAEGINTGMGVSIMGEWKNSPQNKEQQHELHAHQITLHEQHDHVTYPLQKKQHSAEFLRTIPHIRLRTPFNSLLMRMRSEIIACLTSYFSRNGFVQAHPPLITSSDCEGAGEVFSVCPNSPSHKSSEPQAKSDYFFKSPKYLTVSSQLHLEALALAVGKVWALSPTFRAEKSDTPRHLSEFYMLEVEMAFLNDLGLLMDHVEKVIKHAAHHLIRSRIGDEMLSLKALNARKSISAHALTRDELFARWESLSDKKWPRIKFYDALQLVQIKKTRDKSSFTTNPSASGGLQQEHEKFIVQEVGNGSPVFVTDYPKQQKPFYMAPSSESADSTSTVACFDLLMPEQCEVAGGSLREYRISEITTSMKEKDIRGTDQDILMNDLNSTSSDGSKHTGSEAALKWYLDLRQYGSVPHGGYGIGFDRLLAYLAGITNIRDIVTFPRWHGRCDC